MGQSENLVANPVVVLREEFDDWAVLFNPDTAKAVGVNPVGVEIWKLMDGTINIEAINREIEARFKDVPDNSSEEIEAFINNLSAAGLVGYKLEDNSK